MVVPYPDEQMDRLEEEKEECKMDQVEGGGGVDKRNLDVHSLRRTKPAATKSHFSHDNR